MDDDIEVANEAVDNQVVGIAVVAVDFLGPVFIWTKVEVVVRKVETNRPEEVEIWQMVDNDINACNTRGG